MSKVTFTIILALTMLIGQFFLQYFLSVRESRWPGLVLPALCSWYSKFAYRFT